MVSNRGCRAYYVETVVYSITRFYKTIAAGVGELAYSGVQIFLLAALVTFGGAYAVLAYVTQVVAGTYGWITHTQAIDGLALAETTSGPLIMVLQFIGFMAGWNNPQGMSATASAVTGAHIATYCTFLPCFFFIFLGATLHRGAARKQEPDRRAHRGNGGGRR